MISIPASGERSFLDYFGLAVHPFPVAPDDENFFISEHIELITAELVHGIFSRKGFMVLTGEVGLGKTTISRRIMRILEKNEVETALVFHTSLQDAELLCQINRDFGVENPGDENRHVTLGDQMARLNEFLVERNKQGKNCAIIIDDAQNLSPKSLELVRMISNLEAGRQKLVQILLIGQPELMNLLTDPALRQLHSRIVIKATAKPLSRGELNQYVNFKLDVAGNGTRISISPSAVRKIFRYTRGNFRFVNILMDRVLYTAYLYDSHVIGPGIVKYAFNDLSPASNFRLKKHLIWGTAMMPAIILSIFLFSMDQPPRSPTVAEPMVSVHSINLQSTNSADLGEAEKISNPMHRSKDTMAIGTGAFPSETDTPLTQFLNAHGMTVYFKDFQNAVATGDFSEITKAIHDDTGYQLVRLNNLPVNIQGKYGVYSHTSKQGGKPQFFLFWRPDFKVDKFYYYYQGKEIKYLQQLLADINLYQKKTDEIVGSKLLKAIVTFQKLAGIEVTGYPDDTTLFLLSHAKEDMKNG